MDVILVVLPPVLVVAAWSMSRSPRLHVLAAPVHFFLLIALSLLLLAAAHASPAALAIASAALAANVAALAHVVCRSPWIDPGLDVEYWWEDFEQEFKSHVQRQSARQRW